MSSYLTEFGRQRMVDVYLLTSFRGISEPILLRFRLPIAALQMAKNGTS